MNGKHSDEIKRALSDPTRVLDALGLLGSGRERARQARGWIIRCPVHKERTPSCSVQERDGMLVWNCKGCGATGDALTLVALTRGLSMRGRDFRLVLIEAARLAGLWRLVDELERGRPDDAPSGGHRDAKPVAAPALASSEPPRVYPPDAIRFWESLEPISLVPSVIGHLEGRGIDAARAEGADIVRAIPDAGALPGWASYRSRSWRELGFRLIVPMYDHGGVLRSVRAWRVVDTEDKALPKRLPPGGHKASELAMVDTWAHAWLRCDRAPERVVVLEGEPDWLTWATRLNDPHTAVIGVVSGSWCPSLVARFPIGVRVDVRVDHDEAGDRYFTEIESSLRRRTPAVYRSRKEAA